MEKRKLFHGNSNLSRQLRPGHPRSPGYHQARQPGDAAQAQMVRLQLRDELASLASGAVPQAWNAWNLARLGFETTSVSSVDAPDADTLSED